MRIRQLIYCLLILSIWGCNSSTPDETIGHTQDVPTPGLSLDSILKRGTLIAITNNTPTSYFIYKGRPMGYQYDLLKQFAKDLGLQLEIKVVANIPESLESISLLEADILASGLTVIGNRKKIVDFSLPITKTRQILIQRKPDNYPKLRHSKLEKLLLRDVTKLAHKLVHVQEGSAYYNRLINLQNEIGDSIYIQTYAGELGIDSIMSRVSSGEIEYAVTDEYTARFFMRYYDNLDINTQISFNQNIAWAVPKNSSSLLDTLNSWILKNENSTRWAFTYNKYFKHNKNMNSRASSGYNLENGKISPFDNIIKTQSEIIKWDWKLVAAQISVESGFKTETISWAGAQGLMQIMPNTAKSLDPEHENIHSPQENIALGTKLDGILFQHWIKSIPDTIQAMKFSLASYNIGKGHVYDAQRLAEKYDLNPLVWDENVALMIKNLSRASYYQDPVVRHGYCRGIEAYNYVNRVFSLYQNYLNFEPNDS